MRVRYLQALRAVMETGSVTEAGRRLFLTQPQVSRLLSTLEDELGFKLFFRAGRRLAPTREGLQFYNEAKRILAGFDEVSRIADDIRMQKDAWLRIVAQPYLAHGIAATAIAEFGKEHPIVRISMEIRSRADVGLWMSGQQFDLGIAALPIEVPAVRSTPFASVRVVAALPLGHPLAERSVISAEDVSDAPYVALKPASLLRHYIDDLCARRNIPLKLRAETSSGLSACQLVAAGVGFTLADPLIARGMEGVAVRPWEPELRLTYGFLFPTSYAPSSYAQQLAAVFKTVIRDKAPDEVELF